MERKLVDVGHRVEQEPRLLSDITHVATDSGEVRRIIAADARGGEALHAALKTAVATIGHGIQDRRNEVIAYTRREPGSALTAAVGVGFLVGLSLAIGSRAGTGGTGAWRSWLDARRSFLGRRTRSGWRGFLRME